MLVVVSLFTSRLNLLTKPLRMHPWELLDDQARSNIRSYLDPLSMVRWTSFVEQDCDFAEALRQIVAPGSHRKETFQYDEAKLRQILCGKNPLMNRSYADLRLSTESSRVRSIPPTTHKFHIDL